MDVGVVILAAGEGRRFGGNKLLIRLEGVPVLRRALVPFEGMDRVIVVGRYADEIIHEMKDEVILYNPRWREGMSTSIKIGVRFMKDHEYIIVALGDMPFITPEDLNKLISSDVEEAVVPTHKGRRGNPVIFKTSSLLKFMERIHGDEGMRSVLEEMRVKTVECGEGVVRDIDTPADLMI